MDNSKSIKIFAGTATRELATNVANYLGISLSEVELKQFKDGEFQPQLMENVRGCEVVIIQSCYAPVDNYWELFQIIDAAKLASASKIVAVIPYYGYARQDRKDRPRVSLASKMVAKFLQVAGATRVVVFDIHVDQILGYFDIPIDQIYCSNIFIDEIKNRKDLDIVVASPDNGGTRRANYIADALGVPMVFCYKDRKATREIDKMVLVGDVTGKDVILVDDIVDTATTIIKAAELIIRSGARSVRVFCIHPVLSGGAVEKVENSPIEEFYVTDTIPMKKSSEKFIVLTTANLIGETIKRIANNESVSSLFTFNHI